MALNMFIGTYFHFRTSLTNYQLHLPRKGDALDTYRPIHPEKLYQYNRGGYRISERGEGVRVTVKY